MRYESLTNGEQMIMRCIWMKKEHMSLSEILNLANEQYGKDWKPQTVSTFLSHLVKKGYLKLYREGKAFKYQPLVNKADYSGYLLKEHIHFWNDDSMESFAMNLCKDDILSKEKLDSLKKMLNDFDE